VQLIAETEILTVVASLVAQLKERYCRITVIQCCRCTVHSRLL